MDDQLKAVLDAAAQIKGRAMVLPPGPFRDGQLQACREMTADVYRIQRELDARRSALREVAEQRRGYAPVKTLMRGRS